MLTLLNKPVKTIDPTRTILLRRQFLAAMNQRFRWLMKQVQQFLVEEDAFGLQEKTPLVFHATPGQFAYVTDARKLEAFRKWLKEQVDSGVLEVSGAGIPGKPWTYDYVRMAYTKGVSRAYTDTSKQAVVKGELWYATSQQQFLRTAFSQPMMLSKLELLSIRAYDQLVGVTAAMSQQMSRIMADGLAFGKKPLSIAREMQQSIAGLSRRRARTIARTEIIHAHAEGQLDSFQLLGTEKLGIMAEWSTAGDDKVCADCGGYEGETFTVDEARGMIPLHANCRCAWIPSERQ